MKLYDSNHKSYMKNILEARILASIEGLHETNMMQGGFDYVKSTSGNSFFSVCHRVPLTEFVLLEMTVKW